MAAEKRRATLASVAERAGVSRQTVSNVLNSPELVLPATRERVLEAVDALGYRTHVAARQLRTQRSHTLGLCLPPAADGISGEILDRFLHALTEEAQRRGLRVMLFTAPDDEAEIREYATLLATADLDGFVLTSTHRDDTRTRWLAERDVPFVSFGRPWPGTGTAPGTPTPRPDHHAWVDVDGRSGTRAATEHLLALGHRRIGFLGWPEGSGVGDDRHSGWAEAMAAAGVAGVTEAWERRTEDGVVQGAAAARDLLDATDVTALVCVSDSLAIGAMATTREASAADPSLPRPAVVGFDDTPVARAVGLSSVAQPVHEAARHAVGLLVQQIDGPAGGPLGADGDPGAADGLPEVRQILIAPELVVRDTSAAPVP